MSLIRNTQRSLTYWAEIAMREDNGPLRDTYLERAARLATILLALKSCDRDGAEGGDAKAAPVPKDRQARAEGIAHPQGGDQ